MKQLLDRNLSHEAASRSQLAKVVTCVARAHTVSSQPTGWYLPRYTFW